MEIKKKCEKISSEIDPQKCGRLPEWQGAYLQINLKFPHFSYTAPTQLELFNPYVYIDLFLVY